jgi:CBS-domain-containing membrane protein
VYEFLEYQVRHVMTVKPITISRLASLADAEAVFERHQFNALPVVDDDGRLIALVTKLDLLKAFAFTPQSIVPHYGEIMRQHVEQVMTSDPTAVDPEWPLTRVLEEMVRTRNKSFPVVAADGRLVGIIAREDVIRALRRAAAGH